MFDPFEWTQEHLTAALPGYLVTPERDAKVNKHPAVVWALAASNPDSRGIWTGNLTINLLCTVAQAASGIQAIGDAVLAWQTPGPVQSVTLQTLTQNPTSDVAETIKQYTFIYSLTWDL